MNRFRHLLPAALLAAPLALATGQAHAQVNVEVVVNLPSIAMLYYTPRVTVTVPSSALSALYSTGCTGTAGAAVGCAQAATTGTAAAAAGQLVVPITMATPLNPTPTTPTAVPLVLQNVWAVRAIHNNNVTVTAADGPVAGRTLTNGTFSIVTSGATASPGSFAAPGLVNAAYGNVTLNMDLTNARAVGAYAGASGSATYTLTVALP